MSETRFAVILRPDGSSDVIEWPAELAAGLDVLAQELGTHSITAYGLWDSCSLWTDAEAVQGTAPLNQAAENVHSAFHYDAQKYYGTVVVTGELSEDGTHADGLPLRACGGFLGLAAQIPHPRPRTK
ncbi:DUF3846 domain-containing protein [Streptomyces sp. NBC_00441]|uniref:DUF3846 domain-containing protein n=1 Tax=Streptomyces sp. NBC_00441 TaxID=2975742 RepID=UPI002E2B7D21|nr:hypothetical protein [Streptomyces sp. NBC_00441]